MEIIGKANYAQENAVPQCVDRYKRSSILGWSTVEKFRFHGSIEYEADWVERTLEEDLVNYVREQKWLNCNYSFRLGCVPQLRLKHRLMVFYCTSEQKYVVQEYMEIHQEGYYTNLDILKETTNAARNRVYAYDAYLEILRQGT